MIKVSNKNRKNLKTLIYFLFILLLLFILFVLVKNIYSAYFFEKKSKETRLVSEQQFSQLEERRDNLMENIEYLKTEKGTEAELRDKFRVAKEGEEMIVLLDSEEKVVYLEEEKSFLSEIKIFFEDKIAFIKKLLK